MSKDIQIPNIIVSNFKDDNIKTQTNELENTGSATGNPRNTIQLKPGYSLMDWIRFTKSGRDLCGTGSRSLKVTKSELMRHQSKKDAWMSLNGKVFNVTSYMDYHPGGWTELLRGSGKDATKLFNEIHPWVNYESMLSACFIGTLLTDSPIKPSFIKSLQDVINCKAIDVIPSSPIQINYDSYQTNTSFVISIYTKRKNNMLASNVVVECIDSVLKITTMANEGLFIIKYVLDGKIFVRKTFVKIFPTTGKVEITFLKNESWSVLLKENLFFSSFEYSTLWTLEKRKKVAENVYHFVFVPPSSLLYCQISLGHHVSLRCSMESINEVSRKYTPINESESSNLHFYIKIYKDGVFSPYLEKLFIGSSLSLVIHPTESSIESDLERASQLILLAAGTGITPMIKIIQKYTVEIKKTTSLLYFNKRLKDIIWHQELKDIGEHSTNLNVIHILSEEQVQNYYNGRISDSLLIQCLKKKIGSYACICGPISFVQTGKKLLMKHFDFTEKNLHIFGG